jgi:hypothetical protein
VRPGHALKTAHGPPPSAANDAIDWNDGIERSLVMRGVGAQSL